MSSRYLIEERPLTIQPTIVKALGFERAAIVQQFHWLLGQPRTGIEQDGHKWIWGTYDEWCEQYFTFWEPSTLRRHIKKLEDSGILVSEQLKASDWDRTKYYRIDYNALDSVVNAALPDADKSADSMCQHVSTSTREDVSGSTSQHVSTSTREDVSGSYKGTEKTTNKTTEKTAESKTAAAAAPPGDSSATTDADVYRFFESNFGAFTPYISEELGDLCDTHGPQWVMDAMKEAIRAEVRKLKYVAAILARWRAEGRTERKDAADGIWPQTVAQMNHDLPDYLR